MQRPTISSRYETKLGIQSYKQLCDKLKPCNKDIYVMDQGEQVFQVKEDQIEYLKGSSENWDFRPLFDDVRAWQKEDNSEDDSILIISVEEEAAFDELAEKLGATPIEARY